MGLLTKTIFETLTDKVARRVEAAVTTPAPNQLLDCTEASLARYLDGATGDPAVQAALLNLCADVDKQILAPNYRAFVDQAIQISPWKTLIQGMQTYVQSSAGGSYASLGAYASDVGATVHPLFAELARSILSDACWTVSDAIVSASHPQMQTVAFDRVYTGAQGSLSDDTTDAGDTDTADVALFTSDNDILALGSRHRFNTILLDLSTLASADALIDAYYWNGTAWVELALTDGTTGFSVNGGVITFTRPADWEPCCMDMQGSPAVFDTAQEGEYYYLILQRTENTLSPTPVATWIRAIPEAIVDSASKLYGVDQPPLAYVTITDTDTCVITAVQAPQYDRFLCPGTAANALKMQSITVLTSDVTFTFKYTNQAGVAGSKAQTAWTGAVAAGGTKNIVLDTGHTGIQSVVTTTPTITTANTSGVFAIIATGYDRAIAAK